MSSRSSRSRAFLSASWSFREPRSSWPDSTDLRASKSRRGHHARRDRHRSACLDGLVEVTAETVSADMTFKMVTVAAHAAVVLDELTRDLAVGESRKIDRGAGFMPVVVEHLEKSNLGSLFSVAHYYESQNGLVPDPDVTFLRRRDGSWTPISYQDSLAYRVVARLGDDGRVEVNERGQRELVRFANMWLRNVATQQNVPTKRSR